MKQEVISSSRKNVQGSTLFNANVGGFSFVSRVSDLYLLTLAASVLEDSIDQYEFKVEQVDGGVQIVALHISTQRLFLFDTRTKDFKVASYLQA